MFPKKIILTSQDINSYNDNGYLIVKKLFGPDECKKLIELALKTADLTYKVRMSPDHESPEIKNFITDGRIADVVETLHNNMPIDWLGCQIHFRIPGSPFTKGWNPHQDNHYTRYPYGMGVSAIVALEDADRENGCLYAYPGSHKLPILEHEPHSTYAPNENLGNKCEIPTEFINRKVDLLMNQGDLYIQHGNLIHGSHANNSPTRSRLNMGILCIVHGQTYTSKAQSANRQPQPLRG